MSLPRVRAEGRLGSAPRSAAHRGGPAAEAREKKKKKGKHPPPPSKRQKAKLAQVRHRASRLASLYFIYGLLHRLGGENRFLPFTMY